MAGTAPAVQGALRPVRRLAAGQAARAAHRARGAARLIDVVGDLGEARADWSALAERTGNIFATWEWADSWWRVYGDGRRQAIGLIHADDGSPLALLPLCVGGRRPLRLARFIGHGPSDEGGAICAPTARTAAARVLEVSGDQLGWDVLVAERLRPGHRIRGRALRTEEWPLIKAPEGGWQAYLASRSRNFRSQLGRKRRALERDRDLTFRLADEPARLSDDLETLFRLHASRWGEEGSGAFSEDRMSFHRDFASRALEQGWLRLWLAESEGRPVAAWYGFRFGGVESYYQSGRDPAWEKTSIGLVLLAHTIEAAFDDGMSEYRLLRGGESYKDRFATEDHGVETQALGNGAVGRLATAAGARAAKLPSRLRPSF